MNAPTKCPEPYCQECMRIADKMGTGEIVSGGYRYGIHYEMTLNMLLNEAMATLRLVLQDCIAKPTEWTLSESEALERGAMFKLPKDGDQ